jgi:hypothetical protein
MYALLLLTLLQQTPCDSQVSMLESRIATIRAEVQSCRARLDLIEPELVQTRTRVVENERRIEVERETVKVLTVKNGNAQQRIAELEAALVAKDKTIILLVAEVKRAKTWKRSFARVFGVK